MGSPPRGRGKVRAGELGHRCGRITPAWAGKSYLIGTGLGDTKDHPRVGGEKPLPYIAHTAQPGSPPRGRGKASGRPERGGAAGITPAWAGKSGDYSTAGSSGKDHPRVGGEKRSRSNPIHAMPGSPPRGRGKDLNDRSRAETAGITPAWAGKSYYWYKEENDAEDHPRVGGEKQKSRRFSMKGVGSPPRGRGKVHLFLAPLGNCRITPAWAGKRPAQRCW